MKKLMLLGLLISIAQTAHAIEGGFAPDARNYPGLWRVGRLISGKMLCTATLIDESTLIAAAHCLDIPSGLDAGPMPAAVAKKSFYFSQDGRLWSVADAVITRNMYSGPVDNRVFAPGTARGRANDIALVRLKKPYEHKVAHAESFRLAQGGDWGDFNHAYVFGYGVSESSNEPATSVRAYQVRASSVDAEDDKANLKSVDGGHSCPGDSGGPLIGYTKDGYVTLMGVSTSMDFGVSRIFHSRSLCGGVSSNNYIWLPAYSGWIGSAIERLKRRM